MLTNTLTSTNCLMDDSRMRIGCLVACISPFVTAIVCAVHYLVSCRIGRAGDGRELWSRFDKCSIIASAHLADYAQAECMYVFSGRI